MEDVTLVLANSAEGGGNALISALGIGWSQCGTPTPPMALIILIKVPWDQTNTRHTLDIKLVDSDGHPVMLGTDPMGNPAALQIGGEFETGRPPGIVAGTPIDFSQQIQLGNGLPLAPGQHYEWRLEIDGEPAAVRGFYVVPTNA